ncbi:MAG TPA: response regulator transcription factor [Chthoniobacterales bacterium]|nr:response regulator transcription factor [Chthoniobacterales bacterium]
MTQRILLVDDHRLVRAGIRALLEKMSNVEVVAEGGDGRQAFELLDRHRPDIVLLDIAMPNLNGLDAVDRIKKDWPETKVIVLSMHANEEYVVRALRSDVSGYLIKDAAMDELERAIQTVAEGETYLSPRISKRVIRDYLAGINDVRGPLEQLTNRQREVLQLIAEGKNTKEIANTLDISVKTVEAHRLQLMQRLDIHDIPGLVRYSIRSGLVSP